MSFYQDAQTKAEAIAKLPSTDPRHLGETELVDQIEAQDYSAYRQTLRPVALLHVPTERGPLVALHFRAVKGDEGDEPTGQETIFPEELLERFAEIRADAEDDREEDRLSYACTNDALLLSGQRLVALFTNATEGARQDPALVAELQRASELFRPLSDDRLLLGTQPVAVRERGDVAAP